MLRFSNPKIKQRLITHLLSLEIQKDGDDFKVIITQDQPKNNIDPGFIKKIQLFCFPEFEAIESRTFFTFLIGDVCTTFKLGFIQYLDSFHAKIIISDFYYPFLFKNVLRLPSVSSARILYEMYQLQQRKTARIHNEIFNLDGSYERQYLLSLLFKIFTPYDISVIVISLIQTRNIFVVAQKASLCSRISAALPLLIAPFDWPFGIIPVLPASLRDAAETPLPMIIGLTDIQILASDQLSPHVVVNADVGHVIPNPPLPIDELTLAPIPGDQETPSARQLAIQMKFVSNIKKTISEWSKCPGFPHNAISKCLRDFIIDYLYMFTGVCESAEQLISALNSLPEVIAQSQVINELRRIGESEQGTQEETEKVQKKIRQNILSEGNEEQEYSHLEKYKRFYMWFEELYPKNNMREPDMTRKSLDLPRATGKLVIKPKEPRDDNAGDQRIRRRMMMRRSPGKNTI